MLKALAEIRTLNLHRSGSLQAIFGSSMLMIMGASLVYPILPVVVEALSVSEQQIGWVLSSFALPAVFLAPITGALCDLYGRKFILVFCLFLYGLAGGLIVLADSFPILLGLRFLQGVAYAGIMPLVVVLIGDIYRGEQEATAQGMKVVLDRVALLMIPAASGLLGAIAWQMPFLLYLLAIPIAVIAWLKLPETYLERNSTTGKYIRDVFKKSIRFRSLIIISMSSLRFFVEFSFFTYLPLFAIANIGIGVDRGGFLFTIFAIGAIVTASQVRLFSSRMGSMQSVALGFGVQSLCLIATCFSTNLWQLGLILLIFGFTNGIISPTQKSLLTQSVGTELRGGFVAADRVAQNSAKFISPLLAGLIISFADIPTMFIFLGVLTGFWAIMLITYSLFTQGKLDEARTPKNQH